MEHMSQDYIEKCFNDVMQGKFSGDLYAPVIVPSEEGKDIISIPTDDGFSREVFERKGSEKWDRCVNVGEKKNINPSQFIELMNKEMAKHLNYSEGMYVELVPNSNNPTGYKVNGGQSAIGVAAWAAAQINLSHNILNS